MAIPTEKKYVKLLMISDQNNNKFYEMIYEGNGSTFTVKYGRVESTSTTLTKPIKEWDSIYREKTKKGYKDVTEMVAIEVEEKADTEKDAVYQPISISSVNSFIELMRSYTDGLVKKTYTVKAKNVSRKQVDEAQRLINEITAIAETKDEKQINPKLLELYAVIPRFMSNVKFHLLPNLDLAKALVQEQDNIDAMSSQVAAIEASKKDKKEDSPTEKAKLNTFLDSMGVSMIEATEKGKSDFKYILDQLSGKKIKGIFEVKKPTEDSIYEKWMASQENKASRFLIHGTRCSSVIPIIREGLKIRPTGNFQFSGKVYGDGNYFSEVTSKSLNYTGYDNDQILLVYEVHTGNPFTYNGWYNGNSFTLNYPELKKRGYDSTYVKAGNGLLNSEIIAYKEEQCHIKYIIWLNR